MEATLIQKSIRGDVDSFEQLISQYMRYVYTLALRMMGNEADAEDMAQEALIKAFRSISSYREEAKFSTWLYRITVNVCKDALRARKQTFSYDVETVPAYAHASDSRYDPLAAYEEKEQKKMVHAAIGKLPAEGRTIIVLRELMGHSYEDIAVILDIPVGTVRSRISRSRNALKHILIEEYGQGKGGF